MVQPDALRKLLHPDYPECFYITLGIPADRDDHPFVHFFEEGNHLQALLDDKTTKPFLIRQRYLQEPGRVPG
jgi:hypothetical protein